MQEAFCLIHTFLLQELSADVYSSLMKALSMPDIEHVSCYPVRMSAAGAIAQLVEVSWFAKVQFSSNCIFW